MTRRDVLLILLIILVTVAIWYGALALLNYMGPRIEQFVSDLIRLDFSQL